MYFLVLFLAVELFLITRKISTNQISRNQTPKMDTGFKMSGYLVHFSFQILYDTLSLKIIFIEYNIIFYTFISFTLYFELQKNKKNLLMLILLIIDIIMNC